MGTHALRSLGFLLLAFLPSAGAIASWTSLSLNTGYDPSIPGEIGDNLPDTRYRVTAPGAAETAATVLQSDAFPVSGPWEPNSYGSKWIGVATPASVGAPGDYIFKVSINVPTGVNAGQLILAGRWGTDNPGLNVRINGVATGITNSGNFTSLEPFPPGAGLGRFVTGANTVEFIVHNDPGDPLDPNNPVGLRVDGALALAAASDTCWDDLPLGTRYNPGATFAAGGGSFTVQPFLLSDGSTYTFGDAGVVNWSEACQTGNELQVNNVNLSISYGIPLEAITFHFGEHGGNVNLNVNGAAFNGFDLRDAPQVLGGVSVDGVEFGRPGQSCGLLRLTGIMTALSVGGQELVIDCIEPTLVPQFRRNDTNDDGAIDIADVVHTASYLFEGTPVTDCPQAADANADRHIDLTDEIVVLNHLFLGSAPLPPGPITCGFDVINPSPLPGVPCDYKACTPLPVVTNPSFDLHLTSQPLVSGPPGSTVTWDLYVDLCWDPGTSPNPVVDDVRGWSFGLRRVGTGPIAIQSATIAGTDAAAALLSGFRRTDLLASNTALVSSIIRDITPGAQPATDPGPLPSTGLGAGCLTPNRLLRVILEAKVPDNPGDCFTESFELVEGLQSIGEPVPIRLATVGTQGGVRFGGRSVRPVIAPPLSIQICADNTMAGSDVDVDAGEGVTASFKEVVESGNTSARLTGKGEEPPKGFEVLGAEGMKAYYTVSTTAKYNGLVTLCFPYVPPRGMSQTDQQKAIRLMVFEEKEGQWRDVTTSVDPRAHIVCGTSHLSRFGLFATGGGGTPNNLFRRGDSNSDASVDISDAVWTLNYLFAGASPPACLDAADANDDGEIDISDAVRTLNYLFAGGNVAIPAPGPETCGVDPTGDGLAGCGQSVCGA